MEGWYIMSVNTKRFQLTLEHIPTGVKITLSDPIFRTEREAYDAGMKYMRSRLAMLGYTPELIKVEYLGKLPQE